MGIFDVFRKNRSKYDVKKAPSEAVDPIDAWRSDPTKLHRTAPFDDLASPAHSIIALDCFQLWFSNPLANRIVQILVDFIIGDGYQVHSDNEAVKDYLNVWGSDPTVNAFVLADQWANDLMILGEYGLKPEVNEISGFVRLEPVDITKISRVLSRWGMPQLVQAGSSFSDNLLTIIYKDQNPASKSYQALIGDLIFAQINTTTLLSRGYSILLTLRDWIRANDDFIFNELSRAVALRKFFIHLKVNGATEDTLKEYKKKYANPPPAGTMIISNDKEEWNFLSPQLNSGDTMGLEKTIRNLILAGGGIAEHWLAEGGDANLATATAMTKPILKRLTRYQGIFFRWVEQVYTFSRDQAIIAGAIPGVTINTPDIEVEIIPDPIAVEDTTAQWDFFGKVIQSLAVGLTNELVTDGEARDATVRFMNELGIDTEEIQKNSDVRLEELYKKHSDKIRQLETERNQSHG